jgi:5-methylcytosine-specific restriction endonuclease McrA
MSDSDFPYRAQVLAFDPTALLEKLVAQGKIDPFKRRQDLAVDDMLPAQPAGLCLCGCGQKVERPRRKWAHDECPSFGYAVQGILLGDTREIGRWLMRQLLAAGEAICCAHCEATHVAYEVDHKLAVALGGGGRWLDNYQLLCGPCHLIKTANDKKLIAAYRRTLRQPTLF